MSLGFIVQARTGSSRLKSKVLLKLKGQTILEHVIENLKKLNLEKNNNSNNKKVTR